MNWNFISDNLFLLFLPFWMGRNTLLRLQSMWSIAPLRNSTQLLPEVWQWDMMLDFKCMKLKDGGETHEVLTTTWNKSSGFVALDKRRLTTTLPGMGSEYCQCLTSDSRWASYNYQKRHSLAKTKERSITMSFYRSFCSWIVFALELSSKGPIQKLKLLARRR